MEKEGLVRSVTFLKEHDIKIKALVTDGHKMIAKWVRENMPETTHNLDVWHVSKGMVKLYNILINYIIFINKKSAMVRVEV